MFCVLLHFLASHSAVFYLSRLLNHCPGLQWCWPEVPWAPHLCPHRLSVSGCLDLHCYPHKQDLTLHTVHSGRGQEWVTIAFGHHVAKQVNCNQPGVVCVCVFISHFAPVSVSPGLLLTRSSLFCRTAAFFSTAKQHKHLWKKGLKMRPRLASLLLRLTGGVRTPETTQPECSVLCWSITSVTQTQTELL